MTIVKATGHGPGFQDLTGKVFTFLTVLEYAGKKHSRSAWKCRCKCGSIIVATAHDMKGGRVKSCGCIKRIKPSATVHGMCSLPENTIWKSMLNRCRNKNERGYVDYGGRGISVCERWSNSFVAFYADMGPRPSPRHSIDRIDNDGNYEPGNCRWATRKQQNRNSRHNHTITFRGETLCLTEWSERTGISRAALTTRILRRKWTIERALTTPMKQSTQGKTPLRR